MLGFCLKLTFHFWRTLVKLILPIVLSTYAVLVFEWNFGSSHARTVLRGPGTSFQDLQRTIGKTAPVLPRTSTFQSLSQDIRNLEPHAFETTEALVRYRGYPVETHVVQTKDGYLLTLHRIPRGRETGLNHSVARPPVLLQHGIVMSSADWVINGPSQSLGFVLADRGYDVWLGNARGNKYSSKHVNMPETDEDFWNFSWDEMAEYDFPAMIDYILNVTDWDQLRYVGHSMGTTMAFAALSHATQYNDKVRSLIAMAPAVIVSHTSSLYRYLAPFVRLIEMAFSTLGMHRFYPDAQWIRSFTGAACPSGGSLLCQAITYVTSGENIERFNKTRIPVYIHHSPAGSSMKAFYHYLQLINSKTFSRYDHGQTGNLLRYGQNSPPAYNLSNIGVPVALLFGDSDRLTDPRDVLTMADQVPSLVESYKVPVSGWTHLDFLWSEKAPDLINSKVLHLLQTL